MKSTKRILSFLLALLLPLCASAEHLTPEYYIHSALRRFDTLGACVAVFQNGEVTDVFTYGERRIGGEGITADTVFQVGSISKMIANIGLMQLVEEQHISLETDLSDLLGYPVRNPAYPDDPITLRQLMTHTASIRDGIDYQSALKGNITPLSTALGERASRHFYSAYKPGQKRMYSNFGGGLIGALIEKLSGQTLDDYMKEHVFDPLGVTAAYQAARLPENVPTADLFRMPEKRIAKTLRDDTQLNTAADPESHYYLTAGKLIISAPDLAKLMIALCDGGIYQDARLLKESTVDEMITVQDDIGSVSCETGNGLFMNILTDTQVEGRTLYGHGGKAYGMICAAYFDPTDRTGVVMLTNGCNDDRMYNGVGLVGRTVLSLCYEHIIDPAIAVRDPFEVQ